MEATGRMKLTFAGRLSLLLVAAITLSGCATSSTPGGTGIPASSAVSGTIQRALILGGGGPVGRAWEVGILKGLADAGVDVSQADLVVGTSSGAILGTQLRSGKML